jgi:hypothetical protein
MCVGLGGVSVLKSRPLPVAGSLLYLPGFGMLPAIYAAAHK